jgi:hypothetical protein
VNQWQSLLISLIAVPSNIIDKRERLAHFETDDWFPNIGLFLNNGPIPKYPLIFEKLDYCQTDPVPKFEALRNRVQVAIRDWCARRDWNDSDIEGMTIMTSPTNQTGHVAGR